MDRLHPFGHCDRSGVTVLSVVVICFLFLSDRAQVIQANFDGGDDILNFGF